VEQIADFMFDWNNLITRLRGKGCYYHLIPLWTKYNYHEKGLQYSQTLEIEPIYILRIFQLMRNIDIQTLHYDKYVLLISNSLYTSIATYGICLDCTFQYR
jgi:hypothetical protein